MHTILLAEDEPIQQRTVALMLEKLGYAVNIASTGEEAIGKVRNSHIEDISAVLMDINMPGMNGLEALQAIRKLRPDLPTIMLTASEDTNHAVKAMKEGASDFLVKPPAPSHLDITIQNALRFSTLSQELSKLKRDKAGALSFTDLIGHHHGLAEAVTFGRKAAASNVPVLIMGDTGVGKELFARAIHGESKRVGEPFIALNCGAIPENLMESILFGHEKGAFTDATTRTIGKFREAEGGTIFLDEIGELSLEAQVKLLRVLQQKEVEPVGAGKPVKVNVRIISATNRDLRRDVDAGRFREDLYFRLNVLPVTVPPLKDRKEDIIPLAEYFIQRLSASDDLPLKKLSKDASAYLYQYAWPGNVRELENLIHRALVFTDGEEITADAIAHIHEHSQSTPVERRSTPAMHLSLRYPDGSFKEITELEVEAMRMTLDHFDGNITRAASALGIAKSTFYRKMKQSEQ